MTQADPGQEEPVAEGRGPDEDGPEIDDIAEELEHDLAASQRAIDRNLFTRNDFHFYGQSLRDHYGQVPTDISARVDAESKSFVKPKSFDAVLRALQREGIAVLTGVGCGNRVAAGAALKAANHEPVFELSAGEGVADLVSGVQRVRKEHDRAGILICDLDPEVRLPLRRLRAALDAGSAAVFTARVEPTAAWAREVPAIAGVRPDLESVVRSTAGIGDYDDGALERALQALDLLDEGASPGMAIELLRLAADSTASGEKLVAGVAGRSPALEEWLEERPTADCVGSTAAAASLDGVPTAEFESTAAELVEALRGDAEPATEEKRFGPGGPGWPPSVIGLERRPIPTHFGRQDTEVVTIRPPHRRETVISFLWRNLGQDFRRPYLAWLRDLPEHGARVRRAAAIAAGVLFIEDPVAAEQELIRPWALDGRPWQRDQAGIALGVPAASDADPQAARTLVRSWSTNASPNLRRVAVVAYGGPLGLWDPHAAAAVQLWRMATEHPELGGLADRSLVSLALGGSDARRARAEVIGMLLAAAEIKTMSRHAYSLLPPLLGRLTGGRELAQGSLAGLAGREEEASMCNLAALLARAFDAPTGRQSANAAMQTVLGAAAAGTIDRAFVERLIREMKAAARHRGRLPQLGSQIERAIKSEIRRAGRDQDVLEGIHATFYNQTRGGALAR